MFVPLPIDPFIDRIADQVRRSRAVIVSAQPGAGKTTRVPPALAADGPVILLQPRRIAARAIAARIAEERGWRIGREVGWQIRFERRFGRDTRLLVVTEGVLTARLQADPLLSDFRTIVLDEFHERSVHADLALALARQAWRARNDLRIVVMSATLDAHGVSAFLDDCPVIEVPGRLHPIDITYAPATPVAQAAVDVFDHTDGDVLCFLPGAYEIRRAIEDLEPQAAGRDVEIMPLHGSLDSSEQDRALRPGTGRRIIVATNIAETSLTVPRVTAVVDSGLQKVARYDAERGIDSLETERITADAADQRAGRAGRTAAGVVRRLWDARDRLRPHREPEVHRVDLSGTVLDVIAWGGDPLQLEWFERPEEDAMQAALTLLERLELMKDGKLTVIGDQVRRIPLHPRLGRMLVAADCGREMAEACALLSERHLLPPRTASTTCDLLSAIDEWSRLPPHVQRVAREIESIAGRVITDIASGFNWTDVASAFRRTGAAPEADFRRAVFAGYPDRVAKRREPGSPRVQLASGAGAILGPESGVLDGDFLVAIDVQASTARTTTPGGRGPRIEKDSRVRVASIVDREWLRPNASEALHRFDIETGTVKAVIVERYDALVLSERPAAADPEIAAQLLADAWIARGPREDDERFFRRLRFAGRDVNLGALVRAAARGARALDDLKLADAIPVDLLRALDRDAPQTIVVPSGRTVRLEYGADGGVSATVKLQELFGLAETPRVGPRREPILFALTAPNGRPVQLTRDLRSFWDRTYPEVRKELRGRYPKHPWPDDPWKASPTARTTSRRGR